ncbi:MAG: hypothetical protein ACK5V3_08490 [Bdellovibrionales bacterium]
MLIFLIGAAILFFFDHFEDIKSNSQANTLEPQISINEHEKMNRVNQHLKETALQLESDRLRRAQEAHNELQKLQQGISVDTYKADNGLTFENNQRMEQLTEELNRSQALSDDQLSPEQIVQNRLLEIRMQETADQAYKEEYARQFIENARAGGWDIRLGPNFEVLSVRKLRPRKPSLFESSPAQ